MKRTSLLLVWLALLFPPAARAQIEDFPLLPGLGLPIVTKTPEELAKQLESKDVKARRGAVAALYQLKWHANTAVPALIKAMKDPDLEVRGMAAACFRFLGPSIAYPDAYPEAAVPILADLLEKDPALWVRRLSALSLRELTMLDNEIKGEKKLTKGVTAVLLTAMEDRDKCVRLNAATALAILGEDGDKPFLVLAEFLGDEDEELRTEIIAAMKEIGLPALPTLKGCLRDKRALVRRIATICLAEVIGKVKRKKQDLPHDLIPLLAAALNDSNDEVVRGVMGALAEIGLPAKETIPAIINFLNHRNPNVRHAAAVRLGEFGPAAGAAVPALEKALSDSDWDVRRDAPEALAKIAGKAAVPALGKALAAAEETDTNENEYVRRAIVEALGTIGDDPASVVPVLIKALADKRPVVRLIAVRTLASFGATAEAALPRVTELLQDPDGSVREEAADRLDSFGPKAGKAAIPALIKALRDSSWLVRWQAARTLGRLREEPMTVVPALIEALGDEHYAVRMWAAWSLGWFGGDAQAAVPRLTQLLQDKEPNVPDYAAEALKRIKGDDRRRSH
jgi:HEAT repeat protein